MSRFGQCRFRFFDLKPLVDGELELVLTKRRSANPKRSVVPAYIFDMRLPGKRRPIGRIDLRVGDTEMIVKYGGHIGYRVDERYRGRHFAARSIRLLIPLAKRHHLVPLWITCNPDNMASRRTCEIAGGVWVDTVDLPKNSNLYQAGDRQKCRYRFDI